MKLVEFWCCTELCGVYRDSESGMEKCEIFRASRRIAQTGLEAETLPPLVQFIAGSISCPSARQHTALNSCVSTASYGRPVMHYNSPTAF
jgi:hypothetical protein